MPDDVSIVGRDPELDLVRRTLDEVARGSRSRFVLLEADPGIGKSRLLDEWTDIAEGNGFAVFRARGSALETERPFGVLVDAFGLHRGAPDPLRAALGELVLVPNDASGGDLRFRIIEDLCDLVERLAIEGPIALLLDDVQWMDPSSALAVTRLARRCASLPVAIVIAARPTPVPQHLTNLIDALASLGVTFSQILPLSEAHVVELAARMLGASPGPGLRRELAAAGGNPLFVRELIASLLAEGMISIDKSLADVKNHVTPTPSLRFTILRRLTSIDREALELLRMATILGSSFRLSDLVTLTARAATKVAAAISEAVAAGWLLDDGERLRFRHDLVHEALYAEYPAGVRAGLHLEAARALSREGAPPERVAPHFSLGAETGDVEAITWLHRAGQQLATRDPVTAVRLLERAFELAIEGGAVREDIQADMLLPLAWTGRVREAEELARLIMSTAVETRHLVRAGRALASMYWLQYRLDRLADVARLVLEKADLSARERAEFTVIAGMPSMYSSPVDALMQRSERVLAMGRESGEPGALASAPMYRAISARMSGRLNEAIPAGEAAIAEAARAIGTGGARAGEQFLGNMLLFHGWHLLAADRPDHAADSFRASLRQYETIGAAMYLAPCHRGLAFAHAISGSWDDALAESATAVQLAEEAGISGLRAYLMDPVPIIHLHRGDIRRARETIDQASERFPRGFVPVADMWVLPLQALVRAAEGVPGDGLDALPAVFETAASLGIVVDVRWFGANIIHIAHDAGRDDIVKLMCATADELAARSGLSSARGASLHFRGLAEGDPERLATAVEELRKAPNALQFASACQDAGIALAERNAEDGVPLLRQAREAFEALGASMDLARIDAHLRRHGVRLGVKSRRRHAAAGWDSLTDTELRVVRLLSEGRSNPEIGARLFISKRTVGTHVSSVFRKLGVSSRAELAAMATRQFEQA